MSAAFILTPSTYEEFQIGTKVRCTDAFLAQLRAACLRPHWATQQGVITDIVVCPDRCSITIIFPSEVVTLSSDCVLLA